jgi:hypothetical protein
MKRATRLPMAAAIVCLVMTASCNRTARGPEARAPASPHASASADPAPAAPAPTAAWVIPPRGIKTPMPGEPDNATLAAARLAPMTCEGNQAAAEARMSKQIEEMRAAVEQSYEQWKAQGRCEQVYGIGEAFGAGGLGLSGVGEGRGGRGEGIGLGSLGDVGHGRNAARATSASGTNNQLAGVDEADIVKNDGAYVYIAANGALRIVEALNPRLRSVTKLGGDVRELLLEGDRAVAFVASHTTNVRPCTYGYDCTLGGDGTQTALVVLDVADRDHPRIARRIDLSGSLIAARRIGTAVHTVVADGEPIVPTYETWPGMIPTDCKVKGMDAAAVRARFTELERKNEAAIRAAAGGFPTITERGVSRQLCGAMHTSYGDGAAFTTLVSFDLTDDETPATTAVVESRPGVVFASQGSLYFAVREERPKRHGVDFQYYDRGQHEESAIHRFKVGAKASETRYVGSGIVPGHVLNQFAMDEWYGYLRVATTRGHVPDPAADSFVSVLSETDEGNLVRVGAVDHIAPGEDIRAIRFDEDRGYIVTFKKTDPLFVVDLGKPTAPEVLGELKIPGFSTYLHRIDPAHLLSIGFDANDHGGFAYFDGVILQLFDVTRPTEPRLLYKEKLGTRGSSSQAATDHLAFNYFDEKKLLAIPMTICDGGGDGTNGDRLTFSGLLVYDVTVEHGFKRLGGVSHGKAGVDCNTWWSQATSAVKRSIFMDDLVFSIATDRMKVQRMNKLGEDVCDIALVP